MYTWFAGLRWFFENLTTILMVIGTASVLLKTADGLIEKLRARYPQRKLFARLDSILDGSDAALGWIGDTLDKIAFNRDKYRKEHGQ